MEKKSLFDRLFHRKRHMEKEQTYPAGFILAQKKAKTPREKYNMNFRLTAEPNKKQYP